jgi:hypothetical protein
LIDSFQFFCVSRRMARGVGGTADGDIIHKISEFIRVV